MKTLGIICLNLASKYEERVVFKISDLIATEQSEDISSLEPQQLRMIEF
jgi:hypothetical protein